MELAHRNLLGRKVDKSDGGVWTVLAAWVVDDKDLWVALENDLNGDVSIRPLLHLKFIKSRQRARAAGE